jgi:NUDIX domain
MVVTPPPWLGPPLGALPGIAPVELVIAQTDETVVALAGVHAYPAGFDFSLCLRLRNLSPREEQQFPYLLDRAPSKATRCPMSSCASVCSSPTVVRPPTLTGPPTTRNTSQIGRCSSSTVGVVAARRRRRLRQLRRPLRGAVGDHQAGRGGGVKRVEHFNDPDAPAADNLVPAASAVVVDQAGRILLHRRNDNSLWSIPGGAMEVGERIADTAVREVKEETGLDVQPEALVGIYTDPRHGRGRCDCAMAAWVRGP